MQPLCNLYISRETGSVRKCTKEIRISVNIVVVTGGAKRESRC